MALHLSGGKMYWTDGTGKISRANFNGTNIEDIIDTGLSGPGDIAVHSSAGRMYWADRFDIDRADLDGSNVEELTGGLSRGQGIALDISPPGVPPVFTAPPSDKCPDAIFCGEIIMDLNSPLSPNDELGFGVYPFDPVDSQALLFTRLVVELDGRRVAQFDNYVPGEIVPLVVDQTVDASVPHSLHFSGQLDPAFADVMHMQVDLVSPKISRIVPEPSAVVLVLLLLLAPRMRDHGYPAPT